MIVMDWGSLFGWMVEIGRMPSMQKLDISLMRVGATVHFKCGGQAVVSLIRPKHSDHHDKRRVSFAGIDSAFYFDDGRQAKVDDRLLDIVSFCNPPMTDAEKAEAAGALFKQICELCADGVKAMVTEEYLDLIASIHRAAAMGASL